MKLTITLRSNVRICSGAQNFLISKVETGSSKKNESEDYIASHVLDSAGIIYKIMVLPDSTVSVLCSTDLLKLNTEGQTSVRGVGQIEPLT